MDEPDELGRPRRNPDLRLVLADERGRRPPHARGLPPSSRDRVTSSGFRGAPWEVVAVWALLLADVIAVVWTYARLDSELLYHVSGSGLEGGLSRGLVLLSFPIALVSIALALVALDALSRRAWIVGAPAIVACAVTAWPGVVDQAELHGEVDQRDSGRRRRSHTCPDDCSPLRPAALVSPPVLRPRSHRRRNRGDRDLDPVARSGDRPLASGRPLPDASPWPRGRREHAPRRPPRSSPRPRRADHPAERACALAAQVAFDHARLGSAGLPRPRARVWSRQPQPGRLERAAGEARLGRVEDPLGAPTESSHPSGSSSFLLAITCAGALAFEAGRIDRDT